MYPASCAFSGELPDITISSAADKPNSSTNRHNRGRVLCAVAVAPEEISAIEDALQTPLDPIKTHLTRSLALLAGRKNPDYKNSIKEAISAVEAVVKLVTGDENGTLGKLLVNLNLHAALRQAFGKLYGYTSDAEGIRHALLDQDKLRFEDAKFMLVGSSAFVNYVIATNKVSSQPWVR